MLFKSHLIDKLIRVKSIKQVSTYRQVIFSRVSSNSWIVPAAFFILGNGLIY